MQGVTNAAPPSGGLRIVASGEVGSAATSGWTTLAFPEAALFAIIYSYLGDGMCYSCPIMSNGAYYTSPDPEHDLFVRLKEDGTGIEYQNSTGKPWFYTAYA